MDKDIANRIQAFRMAASGNPEVDAAEALVYLESLKQNGSHVFDFQKDDKGRLISLFWMSTKEMESYQRYHDVVATDVTSNPTRTSLVSASIVGIDNEFKTIPLAHALFLTEDAQTHKWMWERFFFHNNGLLPGMFC